ncbi:MAG: hypothetical protein ACYC8T_20865 [Myxococcaceae bacterium]
MAELGARQIVLLPQAEGWTVRGPRAALAKLADLEIAPLREALTWRRMAMAAQVPATGPVLLLQARPRLLGTPGGCWSCGEPLGPAVSGGRCLLCVEAARAALAR